MSHPFPLNRTRMFTAAAICLALMIAGLLPEAVHAQVQTPCRGGEPVGVHHVYSVCKAHPDTGNEVWFTVTDSYYRCPGGTLPVQAFRTHEVATSLSCEALPPEPSGLIPEITPGVDRAPEPVGAIVVRECRQGFWHEVTYQRFVTLDGQVRVLKPAIELTNTGVPCDEEPPPVRIQELTETLRLRGVPVSLMGSDPLPPDPFGPAGFVSLEHPALMSGAPGTRDLRVQLMIVEIPPGIVVPGNPELAGAAPAATTSALQPPVHPVFEGMGISTGAAIDFTAISELPGDVTIAGGAFVIEPIAPAYAGSDPASLIGGTAARHESVLDAYCLQYHLAPPIAGQQFRIAGRAAQQQFAWYRHVLDASRELYQAGQLTPDSEPNGYYHSIRQWSVWTGEEGFDADGFADAFVDHTGKNLAARGRQLTQQGEARLRVAAKSRWVDIQKVLTAAEELQTEEEEEEEEEEDPGDEPSRFDAFFERFQRSRNAATDAYNAWIRGEDPGDLEGTLEDLDGVWDAVQAGKQAWEEGDLENGISPNAANGFESDIARARLLIARVQSGAFGTPAANPAPLPPTTPPADPPLTSAPRSCVNVTEGAFQPSQGVWQDDEFFADQPTKQFTRLSPTRWLAELPMVVDRPTLLFGMRDDTRPSHSHDDIYIRGTTCGTERVPVMMRVTLEDAAGRTVVWNSRIVGAVYLGGEPGPPVPFDVTISAYNGLPRERSLWHPFRFSEEGAYRLTAELVTAERVPTGIEMSVEGRAVATHAPHVRFVPVLLTDEYAGVEASEELVEETDKIRRASQTRIPYLFPIANPSDGRSPGHLRTTREYLLDLSDWRTQARRILGWLSAADNPPNRRDALAALVDRRLSTAGIVGGVDKMVAILGENDYSLLDDDIGPSSGIAWSRKTVAVTSGLRDPASTVAHELAHTYPYAFATRLMEARCGFGYHGYDDPDVGNGVRISANRKTRWRHDGQNALMGATEYYGPPHDALWPRWISQCTYWNLLYELLEGVDPDLYLLSGFVSRDADGLHGTLRPALELVGELDASTVASPTTWALRLHDASGTVIESFAFPVEWNAPDAGSERSIAAFAFRVPAASDVASIRLVKPDGTVADTLTVSASAPTIEIIDPAANTAVDGSANTVTVGWSSADADGETLYHTVMYSPDDGTTWRMVGQDLEGSSLSFRIEAPTENPRIRVYASDGARSSNAEVSFRFD